MWLSLELSELQSLWSKQWVVFGLDLGLLIIHLSLRPRGADTRWVGDGTSCAAAVVVTLFHAIFGSIEFLFATNSFQT